MVLFAAAGSVAAEDRRAVEEIVVTAQKREQAIEDVPISMSVLDDVFIAEHGVTDLHEAMLFVPNVEVDVAGYLVSPRIRGFNFIIDNKAYEPPAGFALDGVVYTRFGYFQSALFDVERVEVLRGPQGTTFGKNTTAGLIDVITKNPADDFSGLVSLQLGERERRRVEVAVGGPIVPDLANFRLAALLDDEDGFVENTTAAISPPAAERLRHRDNRALRAKLALPNLAGSELVLSAEIAELEDGGLGSELWHISPQVAAILRGYDPNVDLEKGNFVGSLDQPDGRTTTLRTFRADWARAFGEWQAQALAAHSIYEEDVALDNDFSPAPALFTSLHDRSPTTTVEVRTVSPRLPGLLGLARAFGIDLGTSDLLAGVFYQRRVLGDSELTIEGNYGPVIELVLATSGDSGLEPPPLPPLPDTGVVDAFTQRFEQRGHAVAGFAHAEWHFAERWTLGFGMRLGYETKKADWKLRFDEGPRLLFTAAGIEEFTQALSHDELHHQPKVSLNYRPFDDVSLFAHWAKAYRSGGFNAFAYRGSVEDELVYDSESATEWGIDAKTTLLDGAARLNLSLYRMDVDDFQVLSRKRLFVVPIEFPDTINAPEARAQGVEADLTWLAAEWLTVIGTMGFNDTEYLDFPFNDCPRGMENTDGDSDPRCDATGRPFWGAPQWNDTLTATVRFPLLAGIEWTASGTMEYVDVYYPDWDLDIRKRQRSFFRWRASLGLANDEQGWSLKVIGENLTDEAVALFENDFLANYFVSIPDASRIVFGQFRWDL